MRKYFIPGCVGRGLDLDLRIRPAAAPAAAASGPKWVGPSWAHVGGPKLGPSGWAHAGPKWVGPSWAQVGPSQKFGTPKKSKNQKFSKSKSVLPKMSARFFMPEKNVPAPFGALPAHFLRGPEKSKNYPNFAYFPWWAHGPYSPGLGPLLLRYDEGR